MRRVVFLVLFGVLLGAGLTAAAGALPGSQGLNPLSWLATVSTVAALVVTVFNAGRGGRVHVRQVRSRGGRDRPPRGTRSGPPAPR